MDPMWNVVTGDVLCEGGRIAQVGGDAVPSAREYDVLDAAGAIVMPGLVQSHVHTCQTLARGRADDLALLDWLRQVVWPYEAALAAADVAAAARLAMAELLLGGTTAIQDMGTVRHTEVLFAVAAETGIRATIGKALMDRGERVPARLLDEPQAAIAESVALCRDWHDAKGGRLRYAFAPRFVLSCSEELLTSAVGEARRLGARLHTHASENRDELAAVQSERGDDNVTYLHRLGMTGPDVGLAHCVWLTEDERAILSRTGTHLLHCPSSNLKLASGFAPVPELLKEGVSISLGADGAPCSNNLDGFAEMRLAALMHRPRCGPDALPARQVVRMATQGGANALGLGGEVGSLETGKRADVTIVDLGGVHVVPTDSVYSALVFACRASDVRHVVVDGKIVVRDRVLMTIDAKRAAAEATVRARAIFGRL